MILSKMKFSLSFVFILFIVNSYAENRMSDSSAITVPLGGNGWLSKNSAATINKDGLSNWSSSNDTVSVYVRLEAAGNLNVQLKLKVPEGQSKIGVTIGKSVLTKVVLNKDEETVNFGTVEIPSPGYVQIKLSGLSKSGAVFASVSDLILNGPAVSNGAAYVKNNQGNYFYWGHRGPSVHLNYKLPDEAKDKIEWFYNEVTVPVGNDVLGSYFMVDGFTGGYFGMQVNSPTDRHILFSIWSPFNTQDPKNIPDSLKIQLLKKGANVHAGEFGNEGSGGQSYMNYPWVADKTYAFLIRAQADSVTKNTIFTAYLKDPDKINWQLIASFKRPKSGYYLKGLYSFLENFEPDMGTVTRKVFFGNQWVADSSGNWYALTNVLFTGDATANINYRKDYSGGVDGNRFYLRNCGFFDDFTKLKTPLVRQSTSGNHPAIDFTKLP